MSETDGGRTALRPEEALRIVIAAAPGPELEPVGLDAALGRALARDAYALVDQPPFDKSAMDGFAHAAGLPAPEGPWRVVGVAAAGSRDPRPLGPGECLRIMTGAMLPPGAAAVQRVEWTEPVRSGGGGPELVRFVKPEKADNVIRRGENQEAGDLLLSPRFLGPQDLGILASSGHARVEVARRPRVAVLSTGDEVAPAGSPLPEGAIYDSNGPQLAAQALACGCDARFLGIVRDDGEELARAFRDALEDCDVLLVSGGVSMGDFDHVPRALAAAGIEVAFHGLAMRPGKPFYFGTGPRPGRGGTGGGPPVAAFGLPGNPVSTFVGFEVLVRPHLAARCGLRWEPRRVGARLAAPLSRRETDRVEFLPARLERGADGSPAARPLPYKGSSMLSALAEADCLLSMDIGIGRVEEGSLVDARLVRT